MTTYSDAYTNPRNQNTVDTARQHTSEIEKLRAAMATGIQTGFTALDAADTALGVLITALQTGRSYTFAMSGVGDQADMSTAGTKTFTSKATVPASTMAVNDYCDWEAEVFVDGADSTPQYTVKLLLGTAELDSIVVATAAANDYVIIRGSGRVTAATTMRMYKSQGETKDGTLALHTHAAAADVTIQAMTSARDVTANIVSNAQHATNLATIKSLRFTVRKAA